MFWEGGVFIHRLHVYLGLMVHRERGTRLTCHLYAKLHRGFLSPPATSPSIPLWSFLDPSVSFYIRGPAVHLPTQREPEINPDAFQM